MDITTARRAQLQLQQAQAEIAHLTRVTTLGEIAASIAHEVTQPLAANSADGEAALRFLGRDPPACDEVRQALDRMIGSGERAVKIVRQIRALTRKIKFEPVPLDLNAVVGDAVLLVQHEVASQRLTLHRHLSAELPCVLGDRIQLQQVVINLVVNGIQAMSTVSDRARELTIRSYLGEAGEVVVSVQDSGVGIEPEDASRLFDAFFTTKPGGMGIGLSICRSIIEGHGGRIWAANNCGPGATFLFSLSPLREGPHHGTDNPATVRVASV
jgi:C4-dicarboxylate-specific signal transduction histidine kinase